MTRMKAKFQNIKRNLEGLIFMIQKAEDSL